MCRAADIWHVALEDDCFWGAADPMNGSFSAATKYDLNTGAELGMVRIPTEIGAQCLEFIGGALWVYGKGRLWKLNPDDGSVIRSVPTPAIPDYSDNDTE